MSVTRSVLRAVAIRPTALEQMPVSASTLAVSEACTLAVVVVIHPALNPMMGAAKSPTTRPIRFRSFKNLFECHAFIPSNRLIIGIDAGPRSNQEPVAIQISVLLLKVNNVNRLLYLQHLYAT
ncbi:hypothetical protein, partial [Sinorhizobium meliloti]|uniref:hypothetical protein n=1 Tax=Rhizobium meliloti TaxID=382 RepID=UPI001F29740E